MRGFYVALVVALVLVLGGGLGLFDLASHIDGTSAVCVAQEAGVDDEDLGAGRRTLWDNIKAGGVTELVIILLSVVAMSLTIEHAVSIRREKLVPPYVLNELEQLFDEEEYEEAMDLCDQEDCFLCRVVGAGLARIGGGYERMAEAIQEVGEEEATTLHQKISYLSLIAAIAPMLGLLGTVMGMIEAFNIIAAMAGAANPADLANGISKALITTATGLIVAIPTMCAYMFFRNRVIKVVQEVGAITGELMERFRPVE